MTTFLIPPPNGTLYHTRLHHIQTDKPLTASDAGFAISSHAGATNHRRRIPISRPAEGQPFRYQDATTAITSSEAGVSGIIALLPLPFSSEEHAPTAIAVAGDTVFRGESARVLPAFEGRMGLVSDADGGSNLVCPRTVIPLLLTRVEGEAWLGSRVFAKPFKSGQLEEGWLNNWEAAKGLVWGSVQEMRSDLGF